MTLIFQEYWLQSIQDFVENRWTPQKSNLDLADVLNKWSFITPLRFMKSVVLDLVCPKLNEEIQQIRLPDGNMNFLFGWKSLFDEIDMAEEYDELIKSAFAKIDGFLCEAQFDERIRYYEAIS